MGESCYLTLDVGTTSIKVAVFSAAGRMLSLSLREYALLTPSENIVELDAEEYWRGCVQGVREAVSRAGIERGDIRSIAACTQGETLIAVDRLGRPLRNAIVWMDNRSGEEADEVREVLGATNDTGQTDVIPTWPATKMLWLRRHEQRLFDKVHKYLLVEDFLLHRLTGSYVGEYSLYTSSYLLDIRAKRWWPDLLAHIGVREEQLVELCESGEVIGKVLPEAAAELGIPVGTPVVTGAMDQTAAMIGAGNTRQGIVSETTGAALVVCATTSGFPTARSRSMAVQCHAVPDSYFWIGWCAAGGMSLKWLRDTFFAPERDAAVREGRDPYAALADLAREVPIGSQGLVFLPFMAGPGTLPLDPELRGILYGLELHHTRPHFVRAVMESMAYAVRQNVEEMSKLGALCAEVRSLGGGARSPLWNQIKADVLGLNVTTMKCPEAASLGTAILQAAATGAYSGIEEAALAMVGVERTTAPIRTNARAYGQAYERYLAVQRRVSGR